MSANQVLTDDDKKLLGSPSIIDRAQEICDAGYKFALESVEELRWPGGFVTVAWRLTVQPPAGDKTKPMKFRGRTVDQVFTGAHILLLGD